LLSKDLNFEFEQQKQHWPHCQTTAASKTSSQHAAAIKPRILKEEEERFLPAGSFAVQATKKCPAHSFYRALSILCFDRYYLLSEYCLVYWFCWVSTEHCSVLTGKKGTRTTNQDHRLAKPPSRQGCIGYIYCTIRSLMTNNLMGNSNHQAPFLQQ
jgi:hypothetical protein